MNFDQIGVNNYEQKTLIKKDGCRSSYSNRYPPCGPDDGLPASACWAEPSDESTAVNQVRTEVLGAERRSQATGDFTAGCTELGHKAKNLRENERVVLAQRRDLPVAFFIVRVVT